MGMKVSSFDLKNYLRTRAKMVDDFLSGYFGKSEILPLKFRESMLYSLMAGGKRIRPVLAMASYEACAGASPEPVLRFASALELIHTYSLIHDDLPAMDDDDLRRGKPTNHKVYGEAMAILAGDGLLTEAFHMLSVPAPGIEHGRLLAVIADVARRAGIWGMVAGQAQDMLSEESTKPSRDDIIFIHRNKTAQLITAAVRMGAMLSGKGARELEALSTYGESVGLAFQIADDLLDVGGETALMGKTAGSDERKGKLTYPAVFGIEESRARALALAEGAVRAVGAFGDEAEPLRAIARYIVERRN